MITLNRNTYKKDLKSLINKYKIKGGDLLYMDFDGDGSVDHATMITGHVDKKELLFTAHTREYYGRKVSSVFATNKKMIIKIIVLRQESL